MGEMLLLCLFCFLTGGKLVKREKLLPSYYKLLAKGLAEGFIVLIIRATVLTLLLCMASLLFHLELFGLVSGRKQNSCH